MIPEDVIAALAALPAPRGGLEWVRAVNAMAESWLAAGDIDRAIAARQLGIDGSVDSPALMVDLMHNLGIDLVTRYERGGAEADLRRACVLAETVLESASDTDRLSAAGALAGRLSRLAELPGEAAALDRALRLITEALAAAPADDEGRWLAANTLAGVQLSLWHRDGDPAALDQGLRTVSAEPTVAGDGASNVIGLLSQAAEQTADQDLLAQALDLASRSLTAATAESRTVIGRMLAADLLSWYEWTGDNAALVEAARVADAAVGDAAAARHPRRHAQALSVRSVVRAELARATDDRAMGRAAIEDARAALDESGSGGADAVEHANQLAMLLAERYDLLGDSTDLETAIDLLDDVLRRGPGADEFPAVATNQATALLSRSARDGSAADLDRAIVLIEAAIRATSTGSADLAARHDTAGRLHAHRGGSEDLATAERHADAAVRATPPGSGDRAIYLNNWATWATDRWALTGAADDLTRAIDLLEQALTVTDSNDTITVLSATIMFNLGARLQDLFEHRLDTDGHEDLDVLQRAADLLDDVLAADHPHLTVVAGKRLGDIAWRLQFWKEGEHAFRLAMAAAGQLAGLRPQRPDKERARSGVQGIGALAALCAARAGDAATAAVHLEQASATLIAEALGVSADGVSFDGIVAGAEQMGRHVLLLGTTPETGVAVLVSPDGGAGSLELPELTESAVDDHVGAFRRSVLDAVTDPSADALGAVDRLTEWTTSALITPLTPLLVGVRRLAVLALGRLAWLPITTAGPQGHDAVLAPLEPLLLIRATSTRTRPATADAPRRIIVWADTGPAASPIPGVVREARRVAECYPDAIRIGERSSAADGDAELEAADRLRMLFDVDVAHLACHCEVDVDRPQETVLYLAPPIRVSGDLGTRKHGRTHVVLSACEAALTGAALPDEALSVATAFLLAGAGVVTAPLWPVGDGVAPAFMPDYHAELAAGADPTRALVTVQRNWSGWPRIAHGPWVVTAWPDAVADERSGVADGEAADEHLAVVAGVAR